MPLPAVRVPHPHVEVRDDLLAGSPCVQGSRVPVRRLWSWHRRGVSVETLLKRYPSLGPARVLDALAFAYDNTELIEADLSREEALLGPKVDAVPGAMNQERLPFRK
ncbi:MAG: DUF433 domain-containing protein [Polyangiaceae bacterium]|jgi:uncharacterized protein (DUF433 family)